MTDIRPMTPADVEPATAMILRGEWGDRRLLLEFATSHPECRPIVATDADAVVGTGIGTVNGPAGWIGAIFVDPGARRHGIGRAITDRVIADLNEAGCETLLLVASNEGRPLYERLGFELQTSYATLEAPGALGTVAPNLDPGVRAFDSDDEPSMAALDRGATGEAREHLLSRFASPASASVLIGPDGELDAFTVRAPWGGGGTIARSVDDGVRIVEARRASARPERLVRVGLPVENAAGIERLERLGWTRSWYAPRMIRGAPLDWRPERIWGQFAMATG